MESYDTYGSGTSDLDAIVDLLVEYAFSQFVYAATLGRFLGELRRTPTQSLELIIGSSKPRQQERDPLAGLDALYVKILSLAEAAYQTEHHTHNPFSDGSETFTRRFLCLRYLSELTNSDLSFISIEDIEAFLQWGKGGIERAVDGLHAVVNFEPDKGFSTAFQFHHRAFLDFLDDKRRCRAFYVPRHDSYMDLAAIALHHITNATVEDCSSCVGIERTGPPELFVSIVHLPSLLRTAFEEDPISEALQKAVRRFSSSGSWVKLGTILFEDREHKWGRAVDLLRWRFRPATKSKIFGMVSTRHRGAVTSLFLEIERWIGQLPPRPSYYY